MGMVRRLVVVSAVAAVTLSSATSASAVVGDPSTLDFVARVQVGAGDAAQACSGALVAPQWVATARTCLPQPALGTPADEIRVTVGGTTSLATWLAPHPQRNVVLIKLVAPATVTPVPVATTPPAADDVLRVAGLGRTADQWVPDQVHTGNATVTAVDGATLTVEGSICKGDAGGPALRGSELVALHHLSSQGGCLGEPAGAARTAVETRLDDLAGWIRSTVADVQVYGVRPDGRLTYSTIDSAASDRRTTVVSEASLGFVPAAMAALNPTTLLITTPGGRLQRVDITANNPVLTFGTPVDLAGGWTHRLLAYDGDGTLYGIAGDTLRRYTVTSAKPSRAGHVTNNTLVGTGFTLQTLTATGPDWIVGTTSLGNLRSYYINPAGGWTPATLQTNTGWAAATHVVSPGGGLYYARTPAGGLQRFRDPAPFDSNGSDLQSFPSDPIDTAGWDVSKLAAVPFKANPTSVADVSVYGFTTDGKLTLSTIDSATGDRQSTVVSTDSIGFSPVAMATLNHDTVLATSPSGRLYRLDVQTTAPVLTFAPPVNLAGGWTHRLLAYDGRGSLYGIAGDVLRRYPVTSAKPTDATIGAGGLIGSGFTLQTLTVAAPGWLLANTSGGELISYAVAADNTVQRFSLRQGWPLKHLTTPGNGVYYGQITPGTLYRYQDANPTDGVGSDIASFPNDPVGTSGWDQKLISAQPFIA